MYGELAGFKLDALPYERMTFDEARQIEGAQVAAVNPGEAEEDNLLGKIEDYQSHNRLNYIVSETIKNPKKIVTWNEYEKSYKFGYELFENE